METMKIYSVYDKKGECYLQPFTANNNAHATRGFWEVCKDEKSPMHNFPDDFCLVKIGEMEIKTGKFHQNDKLEIIAEAKNLVA